MHAQLAPGGVLGGVVLAAGAPYLLGEPGQVLGGTGDLALRLGQAFAGLESEGQSDLVSPLGEQIHGVVQDPRPGAWGGRGPGLLGCRGGVGRLTGQLGGLLSARPGDAADGFAGGGVGDVHQAADLEVLTADEVACGAVRIGAGHGWPPGVRRGCFGDRVEGGAAHWPRGRGGQSPGVQGKSRPSKPRKWRGPSTCPMARKSQGASRRSSVERTLPVMPTVGITAPSRASTGISFRAQRRRA